MFCYHIVGTIGRVSLVGTDAKSTCNCKLAILRPKNIDGNFLAVFLAKHAGAYVASTGSTSNLNFMKELGTDVVIDYTNQDFTDVIHDYDLVVDLIGGETQKRSYQVLKKGGILASALGIIEEDKAEGIHAASVWVQPSGELLTKITKLLESGELRPVIGEVLPFEEKNSDKHMNNFKQVIHVEKLSFKSKSEIEFVILVTALS